PPSRCDRSLSATTFPPTASTTRSRSTRSALSPLATKTITHPSPHPGRGVHSARHHTGGEHPNGYIHSSRIPGPQLLALLARRLRPRGRQHHVRRGRTRLP